MTNSSTRGSFAAGHFELQIDGYPSIAFLKNIDGGWVSQALIEETMGVDLYQIKHTSVVDIDPITAEFGLAGALPVLRWIQCAWRKDQNNRRSGQITHANFDLFQTWEHHFYDALVQEVTFPTLDGASKEGAYIKVKFQPERVHLKPGDPNQRVTQQSTTAKQKMWLANSFRFSIDGLDDMQYTNKIDSFTVKQGVKKTYIPPDRFASLTPTNIRFPNISGTISAAYANKLWEWHTKKPWEQKSGSLEFLSPDRSQTVFRINMYQIGLHKLGYMPSTANQDQIKRVKFDLHVHRMDIDGHGILGFE